jgi:hypothetical protein
MSQQPTVPAKTPEEIDVFLALPDITFNQSKSAQAFKTNLLIFDKDFSALATYLSNLLSFVKYFYTLIDLSAIVQQVLSAIATGKDTVPVLTTTGVGSFTLTPLGSNIYKLLRTDPYTLVLTQTNNANWAVDGLMVQVKQIDGTFVQPVIKTANNQITLYFADGIATNYNIYLM